MQHIKLGPAVFNEKFLLQLEKKKSDFSCQLNLILVSREKKNCGKGWGLGWGWGG